MMTEVSAQAQAEQTPQSLAGVAPAVEPTASAESASVAGESTCKSSPKRGSTASTVVPTDENPALTFRDDSASTTPSNPIASVPDLENGSCVVEAAAETTKEPAAQPSKWHALLRRRRCACLGVLTLLLTGLSVFLCFVLPLRDPDWHLTALDIDVMKFSQVMMGMGNVTEPLYFTADVDFYNPNIIGTTTEPGTFVVYYGDEVMSSGTTKSVTVGGKSAASMKVDIKTQFTKAMADAIVAEVVANNMELKVKADVLVIAKVGLLRVKTRVHCDITAATTRLFQDPATVLKDAACTYSYSL